MIIAAVEQHGEFNTDIFDDGMGDCEETTAVQYPLRSLWLARDMILDGCTNHQFLKSFGEVLAMMNLDDPKGDYAFGFVKRDKIRGPVSLSAFKSLKSITLKPHVRRGHINTLKCHLVASECTSIEECKFSQCCQQTQGEVLRRSEPCSKR